MTRAEEFERLAIAYAMVARAQVSAYQSDDYCAISSMELRFQETYAALKAFALREPEGEVKRLARGHDEYNHANQMLYAENCELRADLAALVPLARLGLVALDDDDGKFPSGDAIRFGVLDGRFAETPLVAQARAILDRVKEAP